jgi:hypothetical protein
MIASTSASDIGCAAVAAVGVAEADVADTAAAGAAAAGADCEPAAGLAGVACADPKMADAILPKMLMFSSKGGCREPPPAALPTELLLVP